MSVAEIREYVSSLGGNPNALTEGQIRGIMKRPAFAKAVVGLQRFHALSKEEQELIRKANKAEKVERAAVRMAKKMLKE